MLPVPAMLALPWPPTEEVEEALSSAPGNSAEQLATENRELKMDLGREKDPSSRLREELKMEKAINASSGKAGGESIRKALFTQESPWKDSEGPQKF